MKSYRLGMTFCMKMIIKSKSMKFKLRLKKFYSRKILRITFKISNKTIDMANKHKFSKRSLNIVESLL